MRIDFFWKKECAGGTLLMRKDILTEKTIKDHQDFFKEYLEAVLNCLKCSLRLRIFIFFPLLQSDSTAIFLGRSGRN